MDVQTTTPHEITQAEGQRSIDALRRLETTRNELARLFAAQPILVDATDEGARQLLGALPGFWAAPETIDGATRSTLLGRYVAGVMKEEALLRGLDGTLEDIATSVAMRVVGAQDGVLAPDLHARELIFGDTPHAGSLIVVADGRPDLALLFTARGGWEAFDSLNRLLETARRRLLESVDAADGTGLQNDAFAEAKRRGTVGSRLISGDVFSTLARRMIDVQHERISLAVDDYDLDSDVPDAAKDLADRIRYELSTAGMLDIDAIEGLREAHLLETVIASRLASVPSDVRANWYEARDAYNDSLATATMLRAAAGVQAPLTMRAFASRELATRLAALGVDESPEAITVEIARIKVLPEPLAALDPLPGTTQARRVSLIDLASQNVGRFSLETLSAVDGEGQSMRDRLGSGAIREMVRQLDLVNRYQAYIEQTLRQGPTAALARKLAIHVRTAQMRLEAAESRLAYYVPGDPPSFIDDREERGFRWVEAALDTPAGERRVGNHTIAVSQLTYRKVPLDGILIFASRASQSAPRLVMYTPDAPDGVAYREFETREDAAKRFLYHPAFREYLLDRLPAEFATVQANGATREFAGDRLAHWVLGAPRDAAYTVTAEPFDEREVRGDFLAEAYDTTVGKYRRDARFLARSTSDADGDAMLGHLQHRLNGSPTAHLASTMLTDIPASLARMAQASWRLYDHMKAGDTGEAFVAFTDAYVNALALVAPPLIGGRHVATAIVRSRAAKQGVTGTPVRLAPAEVRFEDRYAAHRLRKPGKPDDEGIFRVRGESYIEQGGTMYLVRRDTDYGRWRLAPARGALDARFTGPVIEQIDGRWVYAREVGLQGGMRRLRRQLNRLLVRDDVIEAAAAPAGDAAPPVVPGPRPPVQLPLPALMEPMRAEITAALVDNPSAAVRIRSDGAQLQFPVQTRSALLMDPHLHPDIAELSVHQRRVFLHELDARFPLATERADVLSIHGWAGPDGRRLSSTNADVQSPSISSSTGDPLLPSPALTSSQQGRWDEAIATARNAPRLPRRLGNASADNAVTDLLPATEAVPPDEWPARVWYFSGRRFQRELRPGSSGEGVTLGRDTAAGASAEGTRTYPVSVLPPETPTSRLSEALGVSPVHRAGQRDPLGYWVLIDITPRESQRVGRHHVIPSWSFGFNVRRRLLPSGEYQYMLQSERPIYVPIGEVVSTGRRGGQPHSLPALRR